MVTKSVTNAPKLPPNSADTAPGNLADSLISLASIPYCGTLDGRTRPARLFLASLTALIEDRGGAGAMSNGELLVARRAAGAATLCDTIEARIVAGEDIKVDMVNAYLAATNAFCRLVKALGLRRTAKNITPRLSDYLAAKAAARDAAE